MGEVKAILKEYTRIVTDQEAALRQLAQLTIRSIKKPIVRATAIQITRKCPSRDDDAELNAIYNAVRYGDPGVAPLTHGFRYVSDPALFDSFSSPEVSLQLGLTAAAQGGAAGGDCDDHAALICALCAAIGFSVQLRVWAPDEKAPFEHVYAIVGTPKLAPTTWVGMDTTYDRAYVGWEPNRGRVKNAIVAMASNLERQVAAWRGLTSSSRGY